MTGLHPNLGRRWRLGGPAPPRRAGRGGSRRGSAAGSGAGGGAGGGLRTGTGAVGCLGEFGCKPWGKEAQKPSPAIL